MSIEEQVSKSKEEIRTQAFDRILPGLKDAGISAHRDKNGIIGNYKGEPFCIYLKWILSVRMGETPPYELAGIVATRYKGHDVELVKPSEVLTK